MQDIHGQTNRTAGFLKPVLLIALAGIVYAFSIPSSISTEQEYRYLLLGHGLASGDGYRIHASPDRPAELSIPPGYSIPTATVLGISGNIEQSVFPLRLLNVLLAIGFLWVAWTFFSERTSDTTALILTLFTALTPVMVVQAGAITPAMAYAFLSLYILYVTNHRILENRPEGTSGLCIAGVACGLLLMVHLFAVTVAATIGIRLFQQHCYRETGLFAIAFLLIVTPWCTWIFAQEGDTFLTQFLLRDADLAILGRTDIVDIIMRVARHAWGYLTIHIPGSLIPLLTDRDVLGSLASSGFGMVSTLLRLGISGLVIWGIISWLSRHWAGLYITVCGAVLMLWPWADSSMLLPVLPILWLALYYALAEIKARMSHRLTLACMIVTVAGVVSGNTIRNVRTLQTAYADRQGNPSPEQGALQEAISWLQTETASDNVFMCIETDRFYEETGRLCVRPPDIPTPAAIVEILLRYEVDYVISAPAPGRRVSDLNALLIEPIVKRFDEVFIPVYRSPSNPKVVIYAVSKSASSHMAFMESPAVFTIPLHVTM